jgi:hypothetical protein
MMKAASVFNVYMAGLIAVYLAFMVALWLGAFDKPLHNLECSVDDTLTFVAYDVQAWDIAQGTLDVVSEEGGELFVMSRVMLAGETCREVRAEG